MYLFRVSTKRKRAYTGPVAKPFYIVSRSKEEALKWVEERLHTDLEAGRVTRLGRQLGTHIYVGE